MFLELFQTILDGKVHLCNVYQTYKNSLCSLYIGAELRNWLLFFAIPVLCDILPIPFLSHLALLVASIYIFSSQQILEQDFQLAQRLLDQFYAEFSDLYGNL